VTLEFVVWKKAVTCLFSLMWDLFRENKSFVNIICKGRICYHLNYQKIMLVMLSFNVNLGNFTNTWKRNEMKSLLERKRMLLFTNGNFLFRKLKTQHQNYFWGGTGIWTQGLNLDPLHQPFFVVDFFKRGSCELFAQVGFKLSFSLVRLWFELRALCRHSTAWATPLILKLLYQTFKSL
jgi:hypothetical protein